MTNKQELREAAEKAAGAYERLSIMPADDIFDISQHEGTQLDADITDLNAFNEAANPTTVLALLDELEAKDYQLANLTAERDALREGEMGDAQHSNTRAAADIYFQLVEEYEIPSGGSLVEQIDSMRDELEAKDKRIAELEAREVRLPQRYSMLHRTDFGEPYHTEMVYKQHQVLEALHDAGIRINGEG